MSVGFSGGMWSTINSSANIFYSNGSVLKTAICLHLQANLQEIFTILIVDVDSTSEALIGPVRKVEVHHDKIER